MDVVCAIIIQNHKFLIAKRPLHKVSAGRWEFPGGKVDDGESLVQALARELDEELAIQTKPKEFVKFGTVATTDLRFHFFCLKLQHFYLAKEHSAVAWVPFTHLTQYDLCLADREAIKRFASQFKESTSVADPA